ncbi:MAG: GAP family protein [Candidatus Woesearchaeota archaeon]|jgi:cytochrome c biogenesis protein CcdA|nr:GAP family protein [Candidatus Woesearchaeota archaeon]|tara:strand:+ start:791 stop:1504 length:714 start_codon:yes stop_codon:yes gene_type:complete
MVEQLTLGIVIAAALADSINPCVFGVLIFLLAYMVTVFKNKLKMLLAGLIYTTVVYVTYLLIGLSILAVTQSTGVVKPFYWVAGSIAIIAGILEVKDYFWYGRGFSLQMIPGGAEKIKKLSKIMKELETDHPFLSLGVAALLGFVVVLFEFPCTGAPYLAILALLSAGDYSSGIPMLLLYNLIFILPLFVIIALVYLGHTSHKLEKWRKEHRGLMRLGIGLFLLAFGAYLINLALHL